MPNLVINSSISQGNLQSYGQTVISRPTDPLTIPPVYTLPNNTETAGAILRDMGPINQAGAGPAVTPAGSTTINEDAMQTTNPPLITVTNSAGISAWIKANPVMAAGAGALLIYAIYLMTKKGRR